MPAEAPALPARGLIWLPPKLPSVAGFWVRFFAFVLDIVFLHFFLRFSAKGLGDLVFRDPGVTRYTAVLVFLGYFVTLNGPAGRGSTIGKTLMHLRVTNLEGGVPSWAQAIARTAIELPFVLTTYFIAHPFLINQEPDHMQRWLAMMLTFSVGVAMFAAQVVACGFNPFKQGLHDYAARTLVRRAQEQPIPFDDLCASLGPEWSKHHRQPQFSARLTGFMLLCLLGWMTWNQSGLNQTDAFLHELRALESSPVLEDSKASLPSFGWIGESAPSQKPNDATTSGTLQITTPTTDLDIKVGSKTVLAVLDMPSSSTTSAQIPRSPPVLQIQLTKSTLWTHAADDPQLRAEVETFARNYLDLIAKQRMLPIKERYTGQVQMEVTLASAADIILYIHVREHATFKFTFEHEFMPPEVPPATRQ